VLQALVDEQVPVRDLTSIMRTFSTVNPEHREVGEIVESVRKALRQELPGNQSGRRLIGLSANFEEAVSRWVWERDGNRFLALPWAEAEELFAAVKEHLAGRSVRELALVVRGSGLRPFVRRLIAVVAPTLPVLAEEELMERQYLVGEQIEYTGRLPATDD
jgi:flagellar biosynthesis component FlhA